MYINNEEYECQQTAEQLTLSFTKCFLLHCKVDYPNLTKPKGLPAIMPSEVKLLCSRKKDSKTGRLCCTMTVKHTNYLVRTPHCCSLIGPSETLQFWHDDGTTVSERFPLHSWKKAVDQSFHSKTRMCISFPTNGSIKREVM